MWPSATRLVGTAGRVWKTSSSASSTSEPPSDVGPADRAQLGRSGDDVVLLGTGVDGGDDDLGTIDDHGPGTRRQSVRRRRRREARHERQQGAAGGAVAPVARQPVGGDVEVVEGTVGRL